MATLKECKYLQLPGMYECVAHLFSYSVHSVEVRQKYREDYQVHEDGVCC